MKLWPLPEKAASTSLQELMLNPKSPNPQIPERAPSSQLAAGVARGLIPKEEGLRSGGGHGYSSDQQLGIFLFQVLILVPLRARALGGSFSHFPLKRTHLYDTMTSQLKGTSAPLQCPSPPSFHKEESQDPQGKGRTRPRS